MNAGRVSVIVAAYNCASTIGEAVDSCLAQSRPADEVIVVNDGSTDRTADELARFGDRIIVVEQRNGGLAAARNAGMSRATGDLVAWMDADDLMHPDRLRWQTAVFAARPRTVLVSTDFSAFVTGEPDYDPSHAARYYVALRRLGGVERVYPQRVQVTAPGDGEQRVDVLVGDVFDALISGNFVHPPTVMVRRQAFERAGPFDQSLRYSSDWDEILRLARQGEFALVCLPLLRYRRSDLQMSGRSNRGRLPLETVSILERWQATDPELARSLGGRMERVIAASLVEAAAQIGYTDRATALGLLRRGLARGCAPRDAVVASLRTLLPGPVVEAIGRAKRRA